MYSRKMCGEEGFGEFIPLSDGSPASSNAPYVIRRLRHTSSTLAVC